MAAKKITFSVFTKPWKMPLPDLARFISGLGFDGIELPIRPGFQVEPQNVAIGLPAAARLLADFGLKITSIAGPTDEATLAACAESKIPIVRVGAPIGPEGYLASVARLQEKYDVLVPLLDKYGVTVGIQNHFADYVCNAMGLRHLVAQYDPRHVAAIWDAAHNALCGEEPEFAIDIVWSHLCLVNLKNAFWRRVTGPEAEVVEWRPYWTSGRQGLASWPRVAAELKKRGYAGAICLTAEYSDERAVNRLIAEDLAFAKSLFA
ncbi:MAG: sugar phosphate isomerase/epimerase [Anaerolineae bacterium]|nr:sugar phosphate isomerase/epimerase [Anaerolineae bacterium]